MKLEIMHIEIMRGLSRAHQKGALYVDAETLSGFVDGIDVEDDRDRRIVAQAADRLAQYGVILNRQAEGDSFEYRLRDNTTAAVYAYPICNFHTDIRVEAIADIKCGARHGQWAFVCVEHFNTEGGHLGLGMGQVLTPSPTSKRQPVAPKD